MVERAVSLKAGRQGPGLTNHDAVPGSHQEMTLADLLSALKYTMVGRDVVLYFCLAGDPGVHGGQGQDGLGLWVSVPSPEEEQEEAGGTMNTPVEDEGAGIVLRRVGKGVVEPSPQPLRGSREGSGIEAGCTLVCGTACSPLHRL